MLETVSVLEVALSVLVLGLAIDNISLRLKINGVEKTAAEAIGLVSASLKNAVKAEFDTVHGRIDAAFDTLKPLKVQVSALAGEAESEVSTLKNDAVTALGNGVAKTGAPSTNS